jgi:vacuolar-type H+-ATPase subunit H
MDSSVGDRGGASGVKVLSDLLRFEEEQEKKLEEAQASAERELQRARRDAAKGLEKLKKELAEKSESTLKEEKKEAVSLAKDLFAEFEGKEKALRKAFVKNREKAVEAVFNVLLEGK